VGIDHLIEEDKALDPAGVSIFGFAAEVLEAGNCANLI
jgi:hypothetical protein